MNYTVESIKKKIDEIYPSIVQIRRTLHMNPELSEKEENTSNFIGEKLGEIGIMHQDNIAGHGVIGYIPGMDTSKSLALRADIDALPITEKTPLPYKSQCPGIMHACGHDIHTSILIGTGRILKEMEAQLPMGVKLFFQPSEETIGGAKQMIDAGCMKNPDVLSVLGLHVETTVPVGSIEIIPGSMNAASTEFEVIVTGKSSHGAHPDKGIDPLLPACQMVTSLQTVISRRLNPSDAGLITVGQFNSGQKNNIIPNESKFAGIIRALTLENREFIKKELECCCMNIAAAFGATCQVKFRDSYPSLENDEKLFEIIKSLSEETLGKDKVKIRLKPSLIADDFAYFCHETKGLYFNLGTQKTGDTNAAPIHSDMFDPDEECIKTGMLIEVLGILKMMED